MTARDKHSARLSLALWMVVLVCVSLGPALIADGQGKINREYKLKAVYLYRFGTYVTWPKGCFENNTSPFVIGILGPDHVGDDLRKIAEKKRIDGRKIKVINFSQVKDVRRCQILFISRAVDAKEQQSAINKLVKQNILFVGETPVFLKQKGVINFQIISNRVQIIISKSAYQREKLVISAQLLRIATIVK